MNNELGRSIFNGGAAAMAGAAASHPLDLLKVRGQLQGERGSGQRLGPFGLAKSIIKVDGITGLYNGLTASLLRQAVYSGVRFPAYEVIKNMMPSQQNNKIKQEVSLIEKVGSGLAAGAIGAVVANPLDLCLVRMQADGKLPLAERRGYTNVFNALFRISREEGIIALWKGSTPTVTRAMIVTASQFAAYDQIKQTFVANGARDNALTHVGCGICAGFVASFASNPVDVIKSRIMNSSGVYTGPIDCLSKTVKNEGPFALYKGISATCLRTVPYVTVMFLTLEQIKSAWRFIDLKSNKNISI